jgi:hypothetical protein
MSGYVPLEGVISLSHFSLDYYSVKYEFNYLSGVESRVINSSNALRSVASFAVFVRFNQRVLSTIISNVGLLSGYYRAGAVFPRKLFSMFEDVMDLRNYHNWTYISHHPSYKFGESVYTTAWAEYICVDLNSSRISTPHFSVQMLGRFEMPLPTFRCDELRQELMR